MSMHRVVVSPDGPSPLPAARARARLTVMPGPGAFDSYDGFVRSLRFLAEAEVCSLIVAGDEIMDNLLTHGEVGAGGITVLVRKQPSGMTLAFFVESHRQFAGFAACVGRLPTFAPRYDAVERRWRGLGLAMCRNLTSSIVYRPGTRVDRVFLFFAAREPTTDQA